MPTTSSAISAVPQGSLSSTLEIIAEMQAGRMIILVDEEDRENEGDLVLDNTAGSSTTAIACIKTNRNYIMIEKEQKYYDISVKRIDDFLNIK